MLNNAIGSVVLMGLLIFLFELFEDVRDSRKRHDVAQKTSVSQRERRPERPQTPRSEPRPFVSEEQMESLRQAVWVAVSWKADCERALAEAVERGRWFDREATDVLESRRPDKGILKKVTELRVLHRFTDAEQEAMRFLSSDLGRLVASTNRKIEANELLHRKSFFQSIEKTPCEL